MDEIKKNEKLLKKNEIVKMDQHQNFPRENTRFKK